jgi:hypothetical protein
MKNFQNSFGLENLNFSISLTCLNLHILRFFLTIVLYLFLYKYNCSLFISELKRLKADNAFLINVSSDHTRGQTKADLM